MTQQNKLILCILGNLFTLILVIGAVLKFEQSGSYVQFGPNESMTVISVKIDTWHKYYMLLAFTVIINATKVLSEEMGMPILAFNIYNPHHTHIVEFGKLELQILANIMYFISAIRSVFMTMMMISQIDVALFGVIIKEMTSIVTIRMLLNEKTFGPIAPIVDLENEGLVDVEMV